MKTKIIGSIIALMLLLVAPFMAAQETTDVSADAGADASVVSSGGVDISAHAEARANRMQDRQDRMHQRQGQMANRQANKEHMAANKDGMMKKREGMMAKKGMSMDPSKYMEAKQKFMDHKAAFMEAKQKMQACKDQQTEECKAMRQHMGKDKKDFLLNSAGMVLESLERVKARIEATEMDEAKRTELLAKLDARIQAVTESKKTVDGLSDTASPEELKAAVQSIQGAWKETKTTLKGGVGHVMVAKLGNMVTQIKQIKDKLKRMSEKLAAEGKDVSSINSIIENFEAKLVESENAYNEARTVFENAKQGDSEASVKEAHELLLKARTSLKDARELLKQAVAEIRAQNKGMLEAKTEAGSTEAAVTAATEITATTATEAPSTDTTVVTTTEASTVSAEQAP